MGNTSVDRVPEPGLSLITDGDHRIEPLVNRDMEEELRHVTRPKHLVDGRKMSRALLRVEIRREHATRHALPSQELACPAWPSTSSRGGAIARNIRSTHLSQKPEIVPASYICTTYNNIIYLLFLFIHLIILLLSCFLLFLIYDDLDLGFGGIIWRRGGGFLNNKKDFEATR